MTSDLLRVRPDHVSLCGQNWTRAALTWFYSDLVLTRCPVCLAAVLSTALDLVDLSDPAETRHHPVTKSPVRRTTGSRSPRHRTKTEETELVPVQLERQPARPGTPDRTSLDSGKTGWYWFSCQDQTGFL